MASYKRGDLSQTCVLCRSSDHRPCTGPRSEPLWGSVESWQECQGYPAPHYNIIIDTISKTRKAGLVNISGRLAAAGCTSSTVS